MKQLLHKPETGEHVVIFSSQKSWRSYYSQNKNLKGELFATTKFFFYGLSILGPEPAKLAKHCFFLLTTLVLRLVFGKNLIIEGTVYDTENFFRQ